MSEIREYNLHGIHHREEMIPAGMVVVKTYVPHSCPYDYYGMKWRKEMTAVMKGAGIQCQVLETHRRCLYPQGTGPEGRIRFGDDYIPSEYRLVVSKYDDVAAEKAIQEHEKLIHEWLYNNGQMPEYMRD